MVLNVMTFVTALMMSAAPVAMMSRTAVCQAFGGGNCPTVSTLVPATFHMRVMLDVMAFVRPLVMSSATMPVMSRTTMSQALDRHRTATAAARPIGTDARHCTLHRPASSVPATRLTATREVRLFVLGLFYSRRSCGIVDVNWFCSAPTGMPAYMAASLLDLFIRLFILVHFAGGSRTVTLIFDMAHLLSFSADPCSRRAASPPSWGTAIILAGIYREVL
jgi:hypothetical protein